MNSLVVYLSVIAIAVAKPTSHAASGDITYSVRRISSARPGTTPLQSQHLKWTPAAVANSVNTPADGSNIAQQTPPSAPVFIPTAISSQSRIDIKTVPAITTTFVSAGPVTYNAPSNEYNSALGYNAAPNSYGTSIHGSSRGSTNENNAITAPVENREAATFVSERPIHYNGPTNDYNSALGYNAAPNSYSTSIHGSSVGSANENNVIAGLVENPTTNNFVSNGLVHYNGPTNDYNSALGYDTAPNSYSTPIHGSSVGPVNENSAIARPVTAARRTSYQAKAQTLSDAHGIYKQSAPLFRTAPPTIYAYAIASAPLGPTYSQHSVQGAHSAPVTPSNPFVTKTYNEGSW